VSISSTFYVRIFVRTSSIQQLFSTYVRAYVRKKAAEKTFVGKFCTYNVDEIDTKGSLHFSLTITMTTVVEEVLLIFHVSSSPLLSCFLIRCSLIRYYSPSSTRSQSYKRYVVHKKDLIVLVVHLFQLRLRLSNCIATI